MTPNEALQLYAAIKLHFTSATYNAIKYNFKLKKQINLEKRPDRFYINKLARHHDPKGLCIANLCISPHMWTGQFFESCGQENYHKWKKYQDGQTYWFGQELKKLKFDSFHAKISEHPQALRLYLSKNMSLDTLVIINDICPFSDTWNDILKDDPTWKRVEFLIQKYKFFVLYDQKKIFKLIKKYMEEQRFMLTYDSVSDK